MNVIRAKGYTATRIEDICAAAGVTKGSFFHHFSSKEELAIAAADYWGEVTSAFFARAAYHTAPDPLDRLLAYIELRKAMLRGELAEFTCLAGTMAQEVYATHPAIRDACNHAISSHAATLVPDIEAAIQKYGVHGDWTAESLALMTQVAIQGAFVLAKATQNIGVAADSLDHLHRYVEMLFLEPHTHPAQETA
jgi:TetR/AcrR family transcriptional regulator, transcriptional repressor for nem operon